MPVLPPGGPAASRVLHVAQVRSRHQILEQNADHIALLTKNSELYPPPLVPKGLLLQSLPLADEQVPEASHEQGGNQRPRHLRLGHGGRRFANREIELDATALASTHPEEAELAVGLGGGAHVPQHGRDEAAEDSCDRR